MANENARLNIRRIAVAVSTDVWGAQRIAAELLAPFPDEDEILLTPGGRFVPRLT